MTRPTSLIHLLFGLLTAALTTSPSSSSFAPPHVVSFATGAASSRIITHRHDTAVSSYRRPRRSSRLVTKMSLVTAMAQVNQIVNNNAVVMFGVSDEPQTLRVKYLFEDSDVTFTSVDVDLVDNGVDVMTAVTSICGQSTVPLFFIDGEFIGDVDKIMSMNLDGYLGELLENVGALPDEEFVKIKQAWSAPTQSDMAVEDPGLF